MEDKIKEFEKEWKFENLLKESTYFRNLYGYLLQFSDNEFTNNSLKNFIINCSNACTSVFWELAKGATTIDNIIEQRSYYEIDTKLNDFELYCTKLIVGYLSFIRVAPDDFCNVVEKDFTNKVVSFFHRILNITKRQNQVCDFKYIIDVEEYYDNNNDNIIKFKSNFKLKPNTDQYVIVDKREFAEIKNRLNQPTPPQKEIKPIKWLKNSNLLAYLINELKTFGFIDEDSIWAICEQLFVDKKGLPIKAQTFTSMVKNYEAITMYDEKGNPTTQKGKPKTHTEITELIKTLKALSKEIE